MIDKPFQAGGIVQVGTVGLGLANHFQHVEWQDAIPVALDHAFHPYRQ